MTALPRLIAPLLAAGLALTTSAAFAAPGLASAVANIRSGPGTSYAVVDKLAKGDYVIVEKCGASWCKVRRVGPDGYVSRTLLYNPYYGSRAYYQFPPPTPDPGRTVRR
ncbi:MAG: SH3 domain-containing protein [Devosia sp.]